MANFNCSHCGASDWRNCGHYYPKTRIGLRIGALLLTSLLSACSTANNWRLPPFEQKHVEMTCTRQSKMPQGLVCWCDEHSCIVVTEEAAREALRRILPRN